MLTTGLVQIDSGQGKLEPEDNISDITLIMGDTKHYSPVLNYRSCPDCGQEKLRPEDSIADINLIHRSGPVRLWAGEARDLSQSEELKQ